MLVLVDLFLASLQWQGEDLFRPRTQIVQPAAVHSIFFLDTDEGLISSCYDGSIRFWKNGIAKPPQSIHEATSRLKLLSVSADGRVAVWSSRDGEALMVLDVASLRETSRFSVARPVKAIALSPDGRFVVSSGGDGNRLSVYELEQGRCIRELQGHGGVVERIAFSREGGLVASSGLEGTIRLWSARDGKPLHVFDNKGMERSVLSMEFSPCARILACGTAGGVIRVFDTDRNGESMTLTRHTLGVTGLAFSSDGRFLYSGSYDGTVRQWEAASGLEFPKICDGKVPVAALAISRDARSLAVGTGVGLHEGGIAIWDTSKALGKHIPLESGVLEKHWVSLANGNPNEVVAAALELTCGGQGAVEFLLNHLTRTFPSPQAADQMIDALEDESVARRENAAEGLLEFGYDPILWTKLAAVRSPEASARSKALINAQTRLPVTCPALLRRDRAIWILERLRAIKALADLGRGAEAFRQTHEARRAIGRLQGAAKR